MEGHLRLAEAKGCLTGPTSRVQERALQMVLVMNRTQRIEDLFDQIKVRALDRSFELRRLQQLWPKYFPVDPFADAIREDGTIDPDLVDEDAIQFSLPQDASQDEEISAWIRDRERGAVTGAALGQWV